MTIKELYDFCEKNEIHMTIFLDRYPTIVVSKGLKNMAYAFDFNNSEQCRFNVLMDWLKYAVKELNNDN